eukprot:gene36205-59263_t
MRHGGALHPRCRPVPPVDPLPTTALPASASLNYGGDAAGLICGYLLGADAAPREIDSAQAAQWLAGQQAGAAAQEGKGQGQFLWLHFNLSHAQAMRWMERHADLPEAFFDALKD